ncbi:MAG: hypothetical protein J0L53_03210 [Spirochaetes bacterium]|nr:hypothetical protein [Spirochaetota bacterium]
MRPEKYLIPAFVFGIMSPLVNCGSLLQEAQRIQQVYGLKNGGVPSVIATDPADSSIAPYNQTAITVTFSTTVDAATVTPQANFGACTGSLQVSYDGFQNCLGGSLDSSQNPGIRFVPAIFPKGLGLQIRVTSAVMSTAGYPAVPYTSPVGFKLGAPCGNQNCFFSYSTPLMQNAGTSTVIFPIRAASNSNKYLVISGSSSTILDVAAVTTVAGPTVPANCIPGDGAHSFYISAGNSNSGQQAIVRGGNTTDWCLYNPQLNTLSLASTTQLATGSGSLSLQPSGVNGDTFVLRGLSSNSILQYSTTTEAFANVSGTYVVAGSIGVGAHALKLQTGLNTGKWLIFNGSPAPSNGTWLFTESPLGFATSTTTAANMGAGAASFETGSGGSGQVITILGGNSTAVSVLNTQTFGAPTLQNSALSIGASAAALLLNQSGYSPLLLHGGVSGPHTTSLYNGSSFVPGPKTTGAILDGSAQIFISGGASGGAFFIVNGSGMPSTSVYFPSSNSFSPTRMPTSVPNAGSNAFYIEAGSGVIHPGKTMIIGGASTTETALFDPIRFEMLPGPQLPANATADSFNLPLTNGPHGGKVLVFAGSTYYVYNPVTHQFSTPASLTWPAAPGTYGAGGVAFKIAGDNRYVIIRGGGSNQADIFDPSGGTPSFPSALTIGCSVSVAPLALRYTTGGQVKHLVYCNGTNVAIFNDASTTFSGPFAALGGGGAGMQGFVVPSGPDQGKLVIIQGGGSTTTTVHDASNVVSSTPGPSLGSCAAGTGSQLFQITTGTNAGKYLLMAGNSTTNSCFFDTSQSTPSAWLTAGPTVSNNASIAYNVGNGGLAFRTNGGLYPTAMVILPGSNKNVWGTYVP